MIDEKKLIEDVLHNDGVYFEMQFNCTTPEDIKRSLDEYTNKLKEGIVNLIKSQPYFGWISTKETEQLPICYQSVIINVPSCSPLPTAFEGYRTYDDVWVSLHGEVFTFDDVPFWMPMPEPPKEGKT